MALRAASPQHKTDAVSGKQTHHYWVLFYILKDCTNQLLFKKMIINSFGLYHIAFLEDASFLTGKLQGLVNSS